MRARARVCVCVCLCVVCVFTPYTYTDAYIHTEYNSNYSEPSYFYRKPSRVLTPEGVVPTDRQTFL